MYMQKSLSLGNIFFFQIAMVRFFFSSLDSDLIISPEKRAKDRGGDRVRVGFDVWERREKAEFENVGNFFFF